MVNDDNKKAELSIKCIVFIKIIQHYNLKYNTLLYECVSFYT